MSAPLMIDDRAGSRDLMRYEPVRTVGELCRLDSADALIVGNGPDGALLVGVELKSIHDFVSSADTGRLQATQIPAMLATYGVNWLLYYGDYRVGVNNRIELRYGKDWKPMRLGSREVPFGYIEGLIFDLAGLGVHTRHVNSMREAAIWIAALHRYWSKPWDKHHGMRVLDKSHGVSLMPGMDPATLQRTKIAACLPGVGFERALAAAQHFTSVSAMVNADADEWAQVDGIGRVIAKAVVAAIR
jgi:ERCC4-type nuclease